MKRYSLSCSKANACARKPTVVETNVPARGAAARGSRARADWASSRAWENGPDGREDLRLDLAIEGVAGGLVHLSGRADDRQCEAKGVECRLGLAIVQESACVLETLIQIGRELLPEESLRRHGILDRGLRRLLRLRRNRVADRLCQRHTLDPGQTVEGAPGMALPGSSVSTLR